MLSAIRSTYHDTISPATVKALRIHLQHVYRTDDGRLVRRTTVLLDFLVHHVPVSVICERWGLSPSCLYDWQKAFLLRGLDSLVYRHSGGRRPKLTPKQKKRLAELIDAGPLVVGFDTACWNSVLIRVLIWREFCVLYNRHYVCMLLHNMGFSFQKARVVSDHLDAAVQQYLDALLGQRFLQQTTDRAIFQRQHLRTNRIYSGFEKRPWSALVHQLYTLPPGIVRYQTRVKYCILP